MHNRRVTGFGHEHDQLLWPCCFLKDSVQKSYGCTTTSVHSGVSFVGVGYHIQYDRYGRQQAKIQL